MAIFEVVLQQTFASQQIINRWNYFSNSEVSGITLSAALVTALGAIPVEGVYPASTMLQGIAAIQSGGVVFDQITVKNVYDPEDFFQVPFVEPLVGLRTGTPLSPFVAVGFRTSRTRLDIRRATKRFAGVSATDVASNGALVVGYRDSQCSDLAQEMTDNQEYNVGANAATFTPIVVSKEKYTVPGSSPERFAYRYYPTQSEQEEHIMSGIAWDVYNNVRSQTSRQVGKGA